MRDYKKIEDNCIEQMEIDYMPLHDVVREFSGYHRSPTEDDFINSLEFLYHLSEKYELKFLQGSEMKGINKSTTDVIDWLRKKWYSNKYDEIDYGIWLIKE